MSGRAGGATAMATATACRAGLDDALQTADLGELVEPLRDAVQRAEQSPHGDQAKWQSVVAQLDDLTPSSCDFTGPIVRIGAARDCDLAVRAHIKGLLLQLQPWRKGPFALFGVCIDGEWRSNRKWARLAGAISDLRGRRVLDVGCGNGYYLWRMIGQGARLALGIDPGRLFITQFNAMKRYCSEYPAFVLPLTSGQFAGGGGGGGEGGDGSRGSGSGVGRGGGGGGGDGSGGFDTVFSMGVLSHRRDPHGHLRELLRFVRPGGELVVENLLVEGGEEAVLIPSDRYAGMRNIHWIPSALALEEWLRRAGAIDIRLLGISTTTFAEQRATEWMGFHSLADFLDPRDLGKTREGHPAPRRGIFVCRRRE